MITIIHGGNPTVGEAVACRPAATGSTTGIVLLGRSAQRGRVDGLVNAAAERTYFNEIDGVGAVDLSNWKVEIDLVGGGPRFAEGVDEVTRESAFDSCDAEHLAVVLTAGFDQAH